LNYLKKALALLKTLEHKSLYNEAMNIEVIYEDNDVAVINKPAGLVVHADGKREQNTVRDWFVENYPGSIGVGEEPITTREGVEIHRDGIVHRLDKDTSGAMILCKTQEAYNHMKLQFQERTVQKTYTAIVYGSPSFDTKIVSQPIGRSKTFAKWSAIPKAVRGTLRDAITHVRVVERGENFSLVEAKPKTGRTHQIRVHLQYLNYPIVADFLYAGKRFHPEDEATTLGMKRQALHAAKISFLLVSGEESTVEAPLSEDIKQALVHI